MTPPQLRQRLLTFALDVYKFAKPLFGRADTRDIASQLMRASSSAAANYWAACNGRSFKEWKAKIGVVLEESDESLFWLIFIREARIRPDGEDDVARLIDEAEQLTRIFGAVVRTARSRSRTRKDLRNQTPDEPNDSIAK